MKNQEIEKELTLEEIREVHTDLSNLSTRNRKSADLGWDMSGLILILEPYVKRIAIRQQELAEQCGGKYNKAQGRALFNDDPKPKEGEEKSETPRRTGNQKAEEYKSELTKTFEIKETIKFSPLSLSDLRAEKIVDNGEFIRLRSAGFIIDNPKSDRNGT